MRRLARRFLVVITLGALALQIGVATASAAPIIYEAVAGNFNHQASAVAYAATLAAHGVPGFTVEREATSGLGQWQVRRAYLTLAGAQAQVGRLHNYNYRGGVEVDNPNVVCRVRCG